MMRKPTRRGHAWLTLPARVRCRPVAGSILFSLLLTPSVATAHAFGVVYNLPVPLTLYLLGACGALVASWVVFSYVFSVARGHTGTAPIPGGALQTTTRHIPASWITVARTVVLVLLSLTILTGVIGRNSAQENFSMTFFWVAFLLGLTYVSAICGGLYGALTPFRTIPALLRLPVRSVFASPGLHWVGTTLYFLFVAFELSGYSSPRSLGWLLAGYMALTVAGCNWFGSAAWLRHCDFLSVYYRLVSRMAPAIIAERECETVLRRQNPVERLSEKAETTSLVVFVLLMLSTTAFDAFRETRPWVQLYWGPIARLIGELTGGDWNANFKLLMNLNQLYNFIGLALMAAFYYVVYAGFMWATRAAARTRLSSRELGQWFAYSLLPIAFVYNLSHYFTLFLDQGILLAGLVSDPFAYGWNLFGTRDFDPPVPLLSASVVWHCQVGFILMGHIASVFVGHHVAFRLFGDSRQAILSQLPLLVLMVGLTALGLFILSLPIGAGTVVDIAR